VANGWAAVRVNPSLKRNPDEGCWIVFCPFPISRDGNIQLHESLGQHYSQAVIGNQSVNKRHGVESWY
jgi:hypothetical protein